MQHLRNSEREESMSRTNWPALITGIAIGAGIGAALGILFAPQSGEDTRNDLVGAAKDRLNDVKGRFNDATDRLGDVKDRFDNVVESGKDFVRQAQDSAEHVKGHIKDLSEAGKRAYREAKNA
jgi:gas vesicle protein